MNKEHKWWNIYLGSISKDRNEEHKWWHVFFGTYEVSEIVSKTEVATTTMYWEICKKCGKQVTEKQGMTTIEMGFIISNE